MREVIVEAFTDIASATRALALVEYREFLHSVGCPPDEIEAEIEEFQERTSK